MKESQQGDIFGRVDKEGLRISLEAGAFCLRKLDRAEEAQEWEDMATKLAAE